jgi:hypothetical protein
MLNTRSADMSTLSNQQDLLERVVSAEELIRKVAKPHELLGPEQVQRARIRLAIKKLIQSLRE